MTWMIPIILYYCEFQSYIFLNRTLDPLAHISFSLDHLDKLPNNIMIDIPLDSLSLPFIFSDYSLQLINIILKHHLFMFVKSILVLFYLKFMHILLHLLQLPLQITHILVFLQSIILLLQMLHLLLYLLVYLYQLTVQF